MQTYPVSHRGPPPDHIGRYGPAAARFLSLLTVVCGPALASPLFDEQSVLDVELIGPVTTIVERKQDRVELPFKLRAGDIEFDVRVRARGNSRLRVCSFPPLRLNFRESGDDGTLFAGQDKLKLVTECRRHRDAQADVLEEYAAYRIFNLVSDASYRVRLMRLHIVDTDEGDRQGASEMAAFVVESGDEMTARLGGEAASLTGISTAWLDRQQAALVYVFQYLIGNTDWSLVNAYGTDVCCHNGTLVGERPDLKLVPYDFDLAGLVNARYARPDASLGIASVKTRAYRGFCMPRPDLVSAIDSFRVREADIIDVLASLPEIDDRTIRYVERFFDDANDGDRLVTRFEKRCLD